jgi:hypothetical protein
MNLSIKDLEVSKDLSREERAAVRGGGGTNLALVLGPVQVAGNGGFNFASPNTQVAPQTVTQTNTEVDMASVIASANTLIAQL